MTDDLNCILYSDNPLFQQPYAKWLKMFIQQHGGLQQFSARIGCSADVIRRIYTEGESQRSATPDQAAKIVAVLELAPADRQDFKAWLQGYSVRPAAESPFPPPLTDLDTLRGDLADLKRDLAGLNQGPDLPDLINSAFARIHDRLGEAATSAEMRGLLEELASAKKDLIKDLTHWVTQQQWAIRDDIVARMDTMGQQIAQHQYATSRQALADHTYEEGLRRETKHARELKQEWFNALAGASVVIFLGLAMGLSPLASGLMFIWGPLAMFLMARAVQRMTAWLTHYKKADYLQPLQPWVREWAGILATIPIIISMGLGTWASGPVAASMSRAGLVIATPAPQRAITPYPLPPTIPFR